MNAADIITKALEAGATVSYIEPSTAVMYVSVSFDTNAEAAKFARKFPRGKVSDKHHVDVMKRGNRFRIHDHYWMADIAERTAAVKALNLQVAK